MKLVCIPDFRNIYRNHVQGSVYIPPPSIQYLPPKWFLQTHIIIALILSSMDPS